MYQSKRIDSEVGEGRLGLGAKKKLRTGDKMKLTIRSRKYPLKAQFRSKGRATFVCVYEHNVWWTCQGEEQICNGGRFSGDTVLFLGDLQSDFNKTCRSWWRQFITKKQEPSIRCWEQP